MKRLTCLQRKMASDAKLAADLNKQIDNLIDKGYAKKLSDSAMVTSTKDTLEKTLVLRSRIFGSSMRYYSNWTRLSRAVAYWHLYKEKLLNKIRKTSEATRLHVEHIANAQRFIYRAIQLEYFADEYAATTKGQSVCRSSPLWRLQLFIDIMNCDVYNRARGYTSINDDLVALQPEHWATKLIVRSYFESIFTSTTRQQSTRDAPKSDAKGNIVVFQPPAAPHMGGAWERLVRSIKTVLYRIVPNQKFTDESLLTAMMEVEMTVNSRPLTFVPSTTRIKKL
ncbi:hypothetical protein ACLKA6_014502 [Drosophila palustris]